MPHVIIEFTQDLASDEQVEAMLDGLHAALAATGLFEPTHIRLRACPLRFHRCAGGAAHFMHAQVRLHAGRDTDQKRQITNAVLAALQAQHWPAEVITVEAVEMAGESYAKFPKG